MGRGRRADRQVAARLPLQSEAVAEAHAHFRLGRHLLRHGQAAEAQVLAVSAEFWARVDALGDRPYYPPADVLPQGN